MVVSDVEGDLFVVRYVVMFVDLLEIGDFWMYVVIIGIILVIVYDFIWYDGFWVD